VQDVLVECANAGAQNLFFTTQKGQGEAGTGAPASGAQ
jgi:hypothetical protein